MNQETYDQLPKDIQKTIMEVAAETEALSFKTTAEMEDEQVKTISQHCEIYYPTKDQVAQFRSKIQPVINTVVADTEKAGYGKEAKRFLEIVDR